MADAIQHPQETPSFISVTNLETLHQLVRALSAEPAFGVDTESNSLFAYRKRVCLIQFSTPAHDFVLDPFCFTSLEALAPLFSDPERQKIFHAAEYDILCLKRDYGFEFAGVFDTMVAARTLGWKATGLAAIVEAQFGVKLDKKHQRADWGRRPLSGEQLEYARLDTHYLLAIRDFQLAELNAAGRLEEAREEFLRLERVESEENGFDPNDFWRIKGARDLAPRQAAVLRELYCYRERQADHANRPPFKVLEDRSLMEIALHCPRSPRGLKTIHGMTMGQIRRHATGLIKAVQRGLTAPHPHPPRGQRVSAGVRKRYDLLQQWRKEKARARGVESDVILSREVLWTLANHAPRTLAELDHLPDLGPWRRQTYGAELIELLKNFPGQH